MSRIFSKLKSVDFFRKIPTDLTEATMSGAWISLGAAIMMIILFSMELVSFMSTQSTSQLIVDRSSSNDLLKFNFNVSFPSLSCEFATLDVSDSLGTKRMNLTKTVRKTPITIDLEHAGESTADTHKAAIKYDEEDRFEEDLLDIDVTHPLTHDNFLGTLARYPIVVVNFYAPWCHWCMRLEPTWEVVTKEVHDKYPEWDGRIRFAKIDCTAEMELCRSHFIQGFPSLRVFRKGHDDVTVGGRHDHEAYSGDRTKEDLLHFADTLVLSAGNPHHKHASLGSAPTTLGCNMAGFVLVKKVPGTLHFRAKSDGHSFDHVFMNMTHAVHHMYLGTKPNSRKLHQLERLHPHGLAKEWADKLHGKSFVSDRTQDTHEHYMQVVLTTIEPRGGHKASQYDAYEYTAHSHTFVSDDVPSVKVSYDLSPIQIVVTEVTKPWYHFLTTTCAIIGGVFTVAGILDAVFYGAAKLMKKVNLGKNT
eukprot:gene14246-20219_t